MNDKIDYQSGVASAANGRKRDFFLFYLWRNTPFFPCTALPPVL